jgi:tetratricopeptide (TPR) repeat protein
MIRSVLASVLLLAGPASAAAGSPGRDCTAEEGQRLVEAGRYDQAIREFSCLVDSAPTAVEGYRGRIEAELLLGLFSDAVRDYSRVTAFVLPVHPDAGKTILDGYAARLSYAPDDVPALTGASFARWWYFDYTGAIHVLDHLLELRPDDVYANLFRGSSRLLQGATRERGIEDLDRAIELAPESADVRYVVSDAYTYGLPIPGRAFEEAALALKWGLDTPRVHAILASAYNAFGNRYAAAVHGLRHLELVTTGLARTASLPPGGSLVLPLVPGRTWEIPLPASAGETISVATLSRDFQDTILVLFGPDGSPVLCSDDAKKYFAAFDWEATATGLYRIQVTSFEAVDTGGLVVTRD